MSTPERLSLAERLTGIAGREQVGFADLHDAVLRIFGFCGLTAEDAALAAEVVLYPQLVGLDSHGVATMALYVRGLLDGTIKAAPDLRFHQTLPATALLEADNGLGLIVGHKAMARALDLAAINGLGAVAVRNSSHFGSAGYFARQAAERGMIGLAFSNSAPAIAPTGGTRAMLGTNPIGAAAPVGGGSPFVIDMALTTVARSKLRQDLAQGRTTIPDGWAIDEEGRPTNETAAAIEGSLLPIGGAKGYGLAVLVELLCSALPDGPPGADITYENMVRRPSGIGHFFLALEPAGFAGRAAFAEGAARLSHMITVSPAADLVAPPRLPGVRGARLAQARRAQGIPMGEPLRAALLAVAGMVAGA